MTNSNCSRALSAVLAMLLVVAGTASAAPIVIETVPVGDAGNASVFPDSPTGAVAYQYSIGKYEVTAAQYTAFLNAVAKTDTKALYSVAQAPNNPRGCGITRSGSNGNYSYTVSPGYENRPVTYVSFFSSVRFANWLHNGQPTGAIGVTTTEDGAYAFRADGLINPRKSSWKWAIPTEHEWFKAAFYKGGGTNAGYWNYATQSDIAPGKDITDPTGNNANYLANHNGSTPLPIDSPYYTTKVGQFRNSPGAYGTFDQNGNVAEWTETILEPITQTRRPWGGHYMSEYDKLWRFGTGFPDFPTGVDPSYGFRLVQVPGPTTAGLIVGAGMAAILRRKRR